MIEPTTEQWLDLHQAFREYCGATPWQWLDNSDILALENPSGEYKGYCCALGDGGVEYGLSLHIGDEGLAGYLALMTGEVDSESLDAFYMMRALSATLVDREHLHPNDLALIRSLGLKYRGRGKWPLFRSTSPGYVPWYLSSEEAQFLTLALRNVTEIASRMASGEQVLYSESDPGLILTRVLRDGEWRDQWETLRPPRPPEPAADYPNTERLRQLAQSKSKGALVWELSVSYFPTPIQEMKGERPYFPTMILIVDRNSALILDSEELGPSPSPTQLQDALVSLLEKTVDMPSGVVVESASTAQLVESIMQPLGIELFTGPTPALDDARESLMDLMGM